MFKIKVVFFWLKFSLQQNFKNHLALVNFQEKKLIQFGKKVLSKSAYYSQYFKKREINFEDIPIISKTKFIEHFDQINTVGISVKEAFKTAIEAEKSRDFKSEINGITIGLSTGTSGKRALFLASETERAKWAALIMQRVILPNIFQKQRIAFFLRANSNLYSSIDSSLFEFKYFDIFRPIDDLLLELDKFQPHILAAQPSILIDIAFAQSKKNINIKPKQIISFAEVLHQEDKLLIMNQFVCKFKEIYQCTEGFLGVSCQNGTIHLNEDFIKIEKEMIDKYRFFPIITDFSRESQPIVKYRLDDILILKKTPCTCGSKLMAIESISGRDDDVLAFISNKNIIKLYPDLIARRIALLANDTFYKYEIKQVSYQLIEIAIASEELHFEELKHEFSTILTQLLLEKGINDVEFVFKNYIEIQNGNKHRKIQKTFK